ncbi:MAG: STAS domain-containing protein [Verrucomicrobiota bacterium]
MSDPQQPTFLVSAYSDPVAVKINGKANYLNCNAFRDFIEQIIGNGKNQIVLDFSQCRGMDSTFLGILAGSAIELRKQTPAGELVLCNLSERNYELICNLGLQNLLSIAEACDFETGGRFESLRDEEVSSAKEVLEAHVNLSEADQANIEKFQDVIAFLRNQVEKEESN